MFCPNCGASISDDSKFCGHCGAAWTQPKAANQPEAPVAPVTNQPTRVAAPVVGKTKYFLTAATIKCKVFTYISWALSLVCALVIFLGYTTFMNTPVKDLPTPSTAMSILRIDVNAVEELFTQSDVMNMEAKFLEIQDKLPENDRYIIQSFISRVKDFRDTMSVGNLNRLADAAASLEQCSEGSEFYLRFTGDFKVIMGIKNFLLGFAVAVMVITLLMSLCGGIFHIRGLVIAGLVLSTIYTLLCSTILIVVLTVLTHSASIFFISQINAEYRSYRFAR